jgi:hypothetical protein
MDYCLASSMVSYLVFGRFFDGFLLGFWDGFFDGFLLGFLDGFFDGFLLGFGGGFFDGFLLGSPDGFLLGFFDGFLLGILDGLQLGFGDGLLDGLLQARAQREAPGGCELPAGPEPRGTGAGDRGQDHPGVRHGARLRAVRTECGRIS